jgi:hypothetical protein
VVRSQPGLDINRAHKDGAPWWDVDVNKIPDATPTVHTGNYKANPYTVLGKTYYPMQDSRNYRAGGHRVVVRHQVPRPEHRQRRAVRPVRHERGAQDPAAAGLRAGDQPGQRP